MLLYSLRGLKNLNVSVSEKDGDVVFLHKIAEGSASKSYGIHVARLAGVPESLLAAAQSKLEELERTSAKQSFEISGSAVPGDSLPEESSGGIPESQQISFLTFTDHPAVEMLKSLDLMNITPSGAIAVLEQLKEAVENL